MEGDGCEQRRRLRVRAQNLPPNTGKPWSGADEQVLLNLMRRGLRPPEIARRIGRSRDAVASRLGRLGQVEQGDGAP